MSEAFMNLEGPRWAYKALARPNLGLYWTFANVEALPKSGGNKYEIQAKTL